MSKSTTQEKHLSLSPEKETLEKQQRDIFDITDVNLSRKDYIKHFK